VLSSKSGQCYVDSWGMRLYTDLFWNTTALCKRALCSAVDHCNLLSSLSSSWVKLLLCDLLCRLWCIMSVRWLYWANQGSHSNWLACWMWNCGYQHQLVHTTYPTIVIQLFSASLHAVRQHFNLHLTSVFIKLAVVCGLFSIENHFCHPLLFQFFTLCLQCFDAVGWVAGRASGL